MKRFLVSAILVLFASSGYAQDIELPPPVEAKVSSNGQIFNSPEDVCTSVYSYWDWYPYGYPEYGSCGIANIENGCPSWSEIQNTTTRQITARFMNKDTGSCAIEPVNHQYSQTWEILCPEGFTHGLDGLCYPSLPPSTDYIADDICKKFNMAEVIKSAYSPEICDPDPIATCFSSAKKLYTEVCPAKIATDGALGVQNCRFCADVFTMDCPGKQGPPGFCNWLNLD